MTFLSIIPFAVILLFIIIKFVHISSEKLASKSENDGVDIKGTITLIVMLSSFLVALTSLPGLVSYNENNNNNSLLYTIALFTLSSALLPTFISIQKRAKSPLINLQLLKNIVLLPTNILIMTIGIPYLSYINLYRY